MAIDFLIDKGKGLLNILSGGGSKGDSGNLKVGIEVPWQADNESHRLWIEEQGGHQVVMMASKKAPVPDQITDLTAKANALPDKPASTKAAKVKVLSDIAAAVQKNAKLNSCIDTLSPLKPTLGKGGVATSTVTPAGSSAAASAEAAVEAAERDLVAALKAIEVGLGLAGGDLGTETNPIPMDWPKPRLASYPILYLGPKPVSIKITQEALSEAYVNDAAAEKMRLDLAAKGYAWNRTQQPIKPYRPTGSQTPPGEAEPLGVSSDWQIHTGMHFEMIKSEHTDGGEKLSKILRPFGFSSRGDFLQADHVVERQLGGPDAVANLWPLNSFKNGSGGATVRGMKFPANGQKFVSHLNPKNPAVLTMDEVKTGVSSGPVHFRIVSTIE